MNQKLLAEYVKLEAEFKVIEEKKKVLRESILNNLKDNNLEKIESEVFGSFTVAHKTSWKYSPAVAKLEEKVKIAKNKEQEKGTAKATESTYLLYKDATILSSKGDN